MWHRTQLSGGGEAITLFLAVCLAFSASVAAPQAPKTGSAEEESRALDRGIESAQANPQALVSNLEEFLARFPDTPRREQVMGMIFHQSLAANDPVKAAAYAEKLLDLAPQDPQLLSTLVGLLGRQSDPASRSRALHYASRFIDYVEDASKAAPPSNVPAARWQETQALMRATGYLMRGKVYAKTGDADKALADFERSFAAYPMPQVAELTGDVAAQKGNTDRAFDNYLTAFAFPQESSPQAHREQLRRKLGSTYLARHKSEAGLGDLILARYDELARSLRSRFEPAERPNASVQDPFEYTLGRPNGSSLRLAEYRGKVILMDFWATWCGPCRAEGKIVERVVQGFRDHPAALFLAVNVDEDRTAVPKFVEDEHWTSSVVYADGLDRLLGVRALPTVILFDRQGRVVFRQEGFDPLTFEESLKKSLRQTLGAPASPSVPSS